MNSVHFLYIIRQKNKENGKTIKFFIYWKPMRFHNIANAPESAHHMKMMLMLNKILIK